MVYLMARSAVHLAVSNARCLPITATQFPGGEMRVDLPEEVSGKKVCLVGSVLPDANSILELLIAAEGLSDRGCRVRLTIPYLAYARQDKSTKKEVFAAKTVCQILQTAHTDGACVIDVHNEALKHFFHFENVIPEKTFRHAFSALNNPVIVAPDEGGIARARFMATRWKMDMATMDKERLGPGKTAIHRLEGNVRSKNAIIMDDIVDTGNTIIEAARFLRKEGAKAVFVGATHGIFSGNALEALERSDITKLFITNTFPIQPKPNTKIEVLSVEPDLEQSCTWG